MTSDLDAAMRRTPAGVVVADSRLVRRVIKAHRRLPGLGLAVPHGRCYALPRKELAVIGAAFELGVSKGPLPDDVLLVARPWSDGSSTRTELLARLWRAAFHAAVHSHFDRLVEAGALGSADFRERIDRIGQTEFDEVRTTLRHDDVLLPPGDDREAYIEFVALYLELRHFAPSLLVASFPSLSDLDRIDAVVARDVDSAPLLSATCPEGADPLRTVVRTLSRGTTPTFSAPRTVFGALWTPAPPRAWRVGRLLRGAERARRRGNVVRAALLCAVAATGGDASAQAKARTQARADLEVLGRRLNDALADPDEPEARRPEWAPLLYLLAEQAAARRGLRFPIEARLLFDLLRASTAHERPHHAVDVMTWALSMGQRPIVRPLPMTRAPRIARYVHAAAHKVRHVRVGAADRKLLARLLDWATERADRNVRSALRPRVLEALAAERLEPSNLPERVARAKLVEELLDHAIARGYVGLGQLRDAISRNQLKLGELASAAQLWAGDALLSADQRLSRSLDGMHRRGEVYLRALQKVSSVAFGTWLGRIVVLWIVLPLGGAFVVVEGVAHMWAVLARLVGAQAPHKPPWEVVVATAVYLLGVLHSAPLRSVSRAGLTLLGSALSLVLLRLPRWLLTRPLVRRLFGHVIVRRSFRWLIVPSAVTWLVVAVTPIATLSAAPLAVASAAIFVATTLFVNSRAATFLEDIVLDWLAPTWRVVSARLLPGLFNLLVGLFRAVLEVVERTLYRVDEWLHFQSGEGRVLVAAKAILGTAWFFVAYAVRLYVTLLIEPEINPLKHFPVVTVAHKLMLPFSGDLLRAFGTAFAPLGPLLGGTLAGTTAFLLPSVFGFLVWELKENWKLYQASRPDAAGPALVGGHGETITALLLPGFHSGTLPKLYQGVRRAAQREDDAARAGRGEQSEGSAGRLRVGLRDVEVHVRRFVERELAAPLALARRWRHGAVSVVRVELGSNRIRVTLACAAVSRDVCEIAFEEQSGFIVASTPRAGFVDALSDEGRLLFENALLGLHQLAGVDLVRERIEHVLGVDNPYDVGDDGLVVWPGGGYATEVVYRLRGSTDDPVFVPEVRGARPTTPSPVVDRRDVMSLYTRVTWAEWVRAWTAAEHPDAAIPRLVRGPSLLPPKTRRLVPVG